ncbi:ferritin-like domain-containing protein [Allohahella sp. A8]|uniref:ferritin-like domain-containing protein n=1 Tax=Allohahella sp. A8 TaxID=3141461 RepID=UPI000C097FC3|nr:ferritin Dps family protein [Hahellaceae bacterium]|tara:strand:- start:37437 stop:38192 length:756 start_codon:yes stop_codon:yes gene_type:complete
MEKSTKMGTNLTGIDMSPIDSKRMIEGADKYTSIDNKHEGGHSFEQIKRAYIQEADAVGSVPLPGSIKGAFKSMMDKLKGNNPEMLINKLGERLAFERTGVRFYESFILKCEAKLKEQGVRVPMDELREIRDEEFAHFQMLKSAIESMGADPTAMTPDADISAVAAMGVQQVLNDPRTTISQCLQMLVIIESADNAAWEVLIKLTEDLGLDEMTAQFNQAMKQEESHLTRVKGWYEEAIRTQAKKGASMAH